MKENKENKEFKLCYIDGHKAWFGGIWNGK